jgi:uncharacterized phage-associated protein
MHDPRAIANLILEEGQRLNRPVSNVALQKLLYFAHGLHLVQRKEPLVSGFFEAWTYGPVHPTVYHCFKSAGDLPITFRADGVDVLTGKRRPLAVPTAPAVLAVVAHVMSSFGSMTPGQLITVSHAKRAPWDHVVEGARRGMALGLRISDNVISEKFKFHKVSISEVPNVGEPGDDTPHSCLKQTSHALHHWRPIKSGKPFIAFGWASHRTPTSQFVGAFPIS